MQIVVALILLTVMGGICWSLLVPKAEYVIRSSRGVVRFEGKFPASRRAEVAEFLKREFAEHDRIKISAVRTPQRVLRFGIRGKMTDGDRQQIRNFLRTIG
jgi:hypothetical protein